MQVPRNRKRVPWILVLTLITGVAFAAAGYKPVSAAGSFTRHPYEDGFQFKVYVPEGYAGEPVPLMVMLHGCTQNADDFAAGTQMNRLADEENFIVLYPEMNPAANQPLLELVFRRPPAPGFRGTRHHQGNRRIG